MHHVEWRSQKQVGFVNYINQYGDEQVDIVSEDFELPQSARSFKDKVGNNTVTKYIWTDIEGTTYALEWG